MKIEVSNTSYMAFIFFIMLNYGLEGINIPGGYSNTIIYDVILGLSLIMALFCLISRKYKFKKMSIVFLTICVSFYCYISGGNTNLLILTLGVVLVDRLDIEYVLKFIFKERMIILILIVLSSMIGIIDNTVYNISKNTYLTTGLGMGFIHANAFASQAGFLMLLFLAINRKNLTLPKLINTFGVNCLTFGLTKSRASFGLILITLLFIVVMNKRFINKIWRKTITLVFPLVMLFMFSSIYFCYKLGYDNFFVKIINDSIFNGRIGLSLMYLVTYPITLFGQKLDISKISVNTYYALDNGYIYILMYYGIIGLTMFGLFYQWTMMHLKKQGDFFLAFICAISIIWGMYEGMMISLSGNFALLFLGAKFSKMNLNFNGKHEDIKS